MDNVGKRILTYFKDFAVLTAQNFKSMFSLSTLCIKGLKFYFLVSFSYLLWHSLKVGSVIEVNNFKHQ